nr:immunoglobulin light chain junction region [Mus musculus]NSL99321.1 immunoglobulin light chain junction region [Mus musculus]NSL99365.1 immunoglobulin light chain junction region [Mus musculus]NSM00158.1 immunoglobulin light chain junction region [Mus musculus]NSM00284.1 immunoglobulin light chain junction region [Mus musculus]
CLQYDEFMYTF